jgi:hypothetical protein
MLKMHSWPLQGTGVEDMAGDGSYWLVGAASAIQYVLNRAQSYSTS